MFNVRCKEVGVVAEVVMRAAVGVLVVMGVPVSRWVNS